VVVVVFACVDEGDNSSSDGEGDEGEPLSDCLFTITGGVVRGNVITPLQLTEKYLRAQIRLWRISALQDHNYWVRVFSRFQYSGISCPSRPVQKSAFRTYVNTIVKLVCLWSKYPKARKPSLTRSPAT